MRLHPLWPSLFGLLLLATTPAHAQKNSDGSLYSHYGIGLLQSFGSSQVEAMGGAGIGLRSLSNTNYENPAAWSDQVLTRAALGINYQGIAFTDAQDNESRLTSGALNAIQFSFPILPLKLGAALAFQPYTRTSFRVEEEGYVRTDPSLPDSSRYLVDREGRGGLQQVMGGIGYRLRPDLSVGANVSFIFGILEDARRTHFPNEPLFKETDFVTATRLAGVTGRFGVLYSPRRVFSDQDELTVGLTFTLPATLHGTRVQTLGESLDVDTLGTRATGSVDLPFGAGLGAAYRFDSRWTVVADAQYQPWSSFSSAFAFPGYTPGETNTFKDRIRAGAGFEFLPAGNDLLATYFERVAYRLGFYFDQLYVSPVNEVDLRTLAVTGGLSLPALLPGTYIDLNVTVGTQGTTDNGLVRDRFYKLTATVNIGERWFQRQKLR